MKLSNAVPSRLKLVTAHFFKIFFRIRFFNKVLLIYSVILITTILSLSFFISKNVTNEAIENELAFSKYILARVNSYIELCYTSVKNTNELIYLSYIKYPDILTYLQTPVSDYEEYYRAKQIFINYFQYEALRNPIYYKLSIYKKQDKSIHIFPPTANSVSYESNFSDFDDYDDNKYNKYGFTLFSAHEAKYETSSDQTRPLVFSICALIRETALIETIGILAVDFKVSDIKNSYSEYADLVKGSIMLIGPNGMVIYDSSDKYYGKPFPYYEQILKKPTSITIEEDCFINIIDSSIPGVLAVGIIPKYILYQHVNRLSKTIFLIASFSIVIGIFLSFIATKAMGRKIKTIVNGMKKLKGGNLSARIHVKNTMDELGEIALSFNEMSHNLENYINKVYISEIKQKQAELKALQSQINPHFLYNTLESIRMLALSNSPYEVSEMMFILSNLFRRSVKEEMIIEIEQEILFCKDYLELFKMRYPDNLTVRFEISEEIKKFGIIKHLMQPIIENYMLHGFIPTRENNNITISGYMEGTDIIFKFTDDGKGIDAEKLAATKKSLENPHISHKTDTGSIGLQNVHDRIRLIYGMHYGIQIESEENKYTTIIIKIRALDKKELERNVQSVDCG